MVASTSKLATQSVLEISSPCPKSLDLGVKGRHKGEGVAGGQGGGRASRQRQAGQQASRQAGKQSRQAGKKDCRGRANEFENVNQRDGVTFP